MAIRLLRAREVGGQRRLLVWCDTTKVVVIDGALAPNPLYVKLFSWGTDILLAKIKQETKLLALAHAAEMDLELSEQILPGEGADL